MIRKIHGYEIKIGPANKKVVAIGLGMVWMEKPGVFVAKGWNAPLSGLRAGNYHPTLWQAVNYAKYVY